MLDLTFAENGIQAAGAVAVSIIIVLATLTIGINIGRFLIRNFGKGG